MRHKYVAPMTTAQLVPTPDGPEVARGGRIGLHRDRIRLRSVSAGGIHVGSIVDTILSSDLTRLAGFEVALGSEERRFVPLVAVVALGPSGIEVESPLHLVRDLRYYRAAGLALSDALGASAGCRHSTSKILDIEVDLNAGEILAVELEDGRVVPRDRFAWTGTSLRVSCDCRVS
jgi:hypothetical protein